MRWSAIVTQIKNGRIIKSAVTVSSKDAYRVPVIVGNYEIEVSIAVNIADIEMFRVVASGKRSVMNQKFRPPHQKEPLYCLRMNLP